VARVEQLVSARNEPANVRYERAFLQCMEDYGYLDYGKALVTGLALQQEDPAVALLFYRQARVFLDGDYANMRNRLDRLEALAIAGLAQQ
jgi:hypothetical protein